MMKKSISLLSTLCMAAIALVLATALALNLSTLLRAQKIRRGGTVDSGYSCVVISSGSMTPTIAVNDLLVLRGQSTYEVGDIVTFVTERGSLVTHRVETIQDDSYTTKGDANNVADNAIPGAQILGKTVYVLPRAGLVLNWLGSATTIVLLVAIFVLLFLLKKLKGA